MIVCHGVTKIYDSHVVALDSVSFQIDKGEFVFIVGASGSGKSTLIRLLLKEMEPTRGTIIVGGRDISRLRHSSVSQLRRNIGCVFQDFKLLPDRTAAENVAYALNVQGDSHQNIRRKVPEVLSLVGLVDKMNSLPGQLSGGEQQRVAIARAVVTDPTILVADEPTGDLDRQSAEEIMDLIDGLNRQLRKTIIMVTHDPRAAKKAHIIRHLDKGVLDDTHPQDTL